MNDIQTRIQVDFPGYSLNVDLTLPGKGITGIFGASGSGKSTFLRAIAGLERSINSRIVVCDELWHDDSKNLFVLPYKRPVGFVFQDAALFTHLTVRKNLEFGLKRIPEKDRKISFDYVVDLLGIGHLMQRKPDTLSGGEKQRVGIARALATSPKILLMDEPLASLDSQRKAEIIPYLNRLNEELEIPILYVSHALDEIVALADHVVLLENGKVRASGNTDRILTRLDLPIAHSQDAASIINGTIIERDTRFHLNKVAFSGGIITMISNINQIGKKVRLRVQASDVSLTLQKSTDTSILNIIESRIVDLHDNNEGLVMVELDANNTPLLCRITARSASNLHLTPGKKVYAQIKGIAIVD